MKIKCQNSGQNFLSKKLTMVFVLFGLLVLIPHVSNASNINNHSNNNNIVSINNQTAKLQFIDEFGYVDTCRHQTHHERHGHATSRHCKDENGFNFF